jgi:hypothetical protein
MRPKEHHHTKIKKADNSGRKISSFVINVCVKFVLKVLPLFTLFFVFKFVFIINIVELLANSC